MIQNNQKISTKDCLPILLAVFVSDDTVLFGTNSNPLFIYVKYLVVLGLTIYLWLFRKSQRNNSVLLVCLLMCILIVVSSLFNSDLRLGLVYKCTILLLSSAICLNYDIKKFATIFTEIIYVIALISVVCTILLMAFPSIFSFAPTLVNSGDSSFSNLYLYVFPNDMEKVRNYGVFREPGVFQMYLSMALLFLMYKTTFDVQKFFVMIAAIVLTFSTTGYFALFVILGLYFTNKELSHALSNKTKLIIFAVLLCSFVYAITQTNLLSSDGMIFDKLNNTGRHTTIARLSSITSNFQMWQSSPLLGVGLQNAEEMFIDFSLKDYGIASEHNTNTFLAELATFGLFYFLIMFNGILRFTRKVGKKTKENILVLILLIILSIGEKLTFSPFFYILLFYGYKKDIINVRIY